MMERNSACTARRPLRCPSVAIIVTPTPVLAWGGRRNGGSVPFSALTSVHLSGHADRAHRAHALEVIRPSLHQRRRCRDGRVGSGSRGEWLGCYGGCGIGCLSSALTHGLSLVLEPGEDVIELDMKTEMRSTTGIRGSPDLYTPC